MKEKDTLTVMLTFCKGIYIKLKANLVAGQQRFLIPLISGWRNTMPGTVSSP
jgi:hypothetical protein